LLCRRGEVLVEVDWREAASLDGFMENPSKKMDDRYHKWKIHLYFISLI